MEISFCSHPDPNGVITTPTGATPAKSHLALRNAPAALAVFLAVVAPVTTPVLSRHVQNVVVISWPVTEL